jgi:AraC family transcriptional regulator of adaptative response/methylated-DNA-[protein]-cysteine methyltransferase
VSAVAKRTVTSDQLMTELCEWIRARVSEGGKVSLEALGRRAHLSPAHLQRRFRAAIGVSPREYAEAVRLEVFKNRLRQAPSVTDAIYDAGYGSSSRAYEGSDGRLGMTPKEYRSGGDRLEVSWTVLDLPELADVGRLLVAATDRGLCSVALGSSASELERRLRGEFPKARLQVVKAPYSNQLRGWIEALRAHLRDGRAASERKLPLDLRATAFRFDVWRYLRTIPKGETRTYSEVAAAVGRPTAVRAVASACAANPVALLVPCHRVLRADGELGGYRWGIERKRRLLARERSSRVSS